LRYVFSDCTKSVCQPTPPVNLLSEIQSIANMQLKAIALSNAMRRIESNKSMVNIKEAKEKELQVENALRALNAGVFSVLPVMHNPNAIQGKAWLASKNWNSVIHKFFVLKGESWAGKTFAGIASLVERMDSSKTPHGTNWNGLFVTMADLKDCMGADAHKQKRRDEIKNKAYLMIDDLQADNSVTPAFQEWFKTLIHHRHAQGKVTIITTNANEENLVTTYTQPIINRISSGLNVTVTEKIK
jgi:chromosomal replication initiation ATPase DnaA